MLDHNKSHQVDDINEVWRCQKPKEVQELGLEKVINHQQSNIKDYGLQLLHAYLSGYSLTAEKLLKNSPLAAQKYNVWLTNKGRIQKSFNKSSISSLDAPQYKKRGLKRKETGQNNLFVGDPEFGKG